MGTSKCTDTIKLLDKQKPIPFSCPLCEAEYKIVTIDTCDAQYGKISCMKCGFPFPASEGRVAFKYFLVGRSSGRKREMRPHQAEKLKASTECRGP